MKYHIPTTARAWLKEKRNFGKVDNFHLLLNRFLELEPPRRQNDKPKFTSFRPGDFFEKFNFDKIPFSELCARLSSHAGLINATSATLRFETTERLVLGAASVLENSLRLHHIWGFPFIPGSSVKGVVRSYIMQSLFMENADDDKAEKRALQDAGFRQMFGVSDMIDGKQRDRIGSVAFYDAIPVRAPKLCVDIMNPHYQPYFSEGKPPADYHSPVPIFFLTIDRSNVFQFCLGATDQKPLPESSKLCTREGPQTPLVLARHWLTEALRNIGIGGKTSVGYGLMKKVKGS